MTNKKEENVVTGAVLAEGESVVPEGSLESYKRLASEADTQEIITATSTRKKPKTEQDVMGNIPNGAIGVTTKKVATRTANKKPAVKKQKEEEKIAIFSERNMTWGDVGKVYRGYNIVTKGQAEKWLTRKQCREATPEEVAREFDV